MAVVQGEPISDQAFTAFDAALAAAVGAKRGGESDQADEVDEAIDQVGERLEALVSLLVALPDGIQVAEIARCERRLATARMLAVSRKVGSSGDAKVDRRRARNELSDANASTRSVNRDARRAAAVASNDRLQDRLADGAIGVETVDSLLKASDETSGALPDELIDAVVGLAPDQAARTVDHYLEQNADAGDVEEAYRRQYEARRVYRYDVTPGGGRPALAGIGIEGPDADIARLWSLVDGLADARYQANGGRDRPACDHASLDHRRYDGLADVLEGKLAGGGVAGRPAVVITVDAAQLFDDPNADIVATQLGVGSIPKSVLDRHLSTASLSVLVRGSDGAPLWLGRTRRHASQAQFLALAVRDRGCVLCRADIGRCVAHHLMPWSSPGKGRTDVDQMALLCRSCHRDLHHRNHTLYQSMSNRDERRPWATRPATPQETPAPRPPRLERRHPQRE